MKCRKIPIIKRIGNRVTTRFDECEKGDFMNLSDMLSYADISQLAVIARGYGCECNGHSKHELIQSILATVQKRDIIKAKLESMDLEELRFLNMLLFETRKSFSLEDLIAKVQQCRFNDEKQEMLAVEPKPKTKGKKKSVAQASLPSSPREMIVRFKQQGWLFNGHGSNGRYLFHVPEDMKDRFKSMLTEIHTSSINSVREPAQFREELGQLVVDMNTMIRYISNYSPLVAVDGIMHRRFVLQLSDLFVIKEQLPSRGAWKFGYGKGFGDYGDRMAFMYDFMYTQGLLGIENDRLIITDKGSKISADENMMQSIVMHWLKLYRNAIPNLSALYYWVCSLSIDWITLQSLQQILEPIIRPYYFDNAEAILHKRIIKMLVHFGILQIAETEQGTAVKLSRYGGALFKVTL